MTVKIEVNDNGAKELFEINKEGAGYRILQGGRVILDPFPTFKGVMDFMTNYLTALEQ